MPPVGGGDFARRSRSVTRSLRQVAPVLALAAVAAVVACGEPSEARDVRARAELFAETLVELSGMTASEARSELEPYLEPGPDRERHLERYVSEFSADSGKGRVLESSVASVTVSRDRTEAVVAFTMTVRVPDGREVEAEQLTHWRLVDGRWYRTATRPEKRISG
jgi:hypothetical protein